MAAIGQLAGGVAHDFNNNLTAIIGSLELMQEMDDPREHAFDVENALVAARQAAKTVKHLMIFARREKPDITRLEVQDIFAELDTLTRRLIPTSVSFQTSMTAPELSVHADRNQLLTALVNLIVNSIDAMPQGGDIFLNADQTRITQPRDLTNGTQLAAGRYVELSVTDTGEGISDDILSKVIDPFFTTKPVGKGTGLGLSMVAGMMQELGGGLSIQSGPETTCVSLYLPVTAN
jgi:signal transduction histidine kinase